METSSDVPEPGPYVPRDPGPDVERYWLPSTRAVAIEWARWARLPNYSGLAVDHATLERVADAVMDPANPPPWSPYTAEERTDELPSGVWEAVHGYLIDTPRSRGTSTFGGVTKGGRSSSGSLAIRSRTGPHWHGSRAAG